jgi:hypothetical protein
MYTYLDIPERKDSEEGFRPAACEDRKPDEATVGRRKNSGEDNPNCTIPQYWF